MDPLRAQLAFPLLPTRWANPPESPPKRFFELRALGLEPKTYGLKGRCSTG
jgi:hypothetical protein